LVCDGGDWRRMIGMTYKRYLVFGSGLYLGEEASHNCSSSDCFKQLKACWCSRSARSTASYMRDLSAMFNDARNEWNAYAASMADRKARLAPVPSGKNGSISASPTSATNSRSRRAVCCRRERVSDSRGGARSAVPVESLGDDAALKKSLDGATA
jgi:hypothetical protein